MIIDNDIRFNSTYDTFTNKSKQNFVAFCLSCVKYSLLKHIFKLF